MNHSRLRAAVEGLRISFAGRCLEALVRLQALDRAMALAAQAFTALVPLLLLVGTLAPAGREDIVADAVIRRFRLDAGAADAVRTVFSAPGGSSVGVLSVVLLVFSGVSFSRRLQRTYVDVWGLPRSSGLRSSVDALLGLAALVVDVVLLSVVRGVAAGLPSGWLLGGPATALASLLLWTSVPWLLLDRRVPWRRLLPTGALTAACTTAYGLATTVYMPRLFESYSLRYGLFGVTLALIGWLLSIALIVVGSAVVAVEFERTPPSWRRWVRAGRGGSAGPEAERPAQPPVRAEGGTVMRSG